MIYRNALLTLALATGLAMTAQPAGGPPTGAPPQSSRPEVPLLEVLRFGDKISLTQAQAQAIFEVLKAHQQTLQSTGKTVHEAEETFHTTLLETDATADTLAGLNVTLATANLAAATEQRATLQACLAVLTSEQVAKLKELQAQIKQLQDTLQALLAPPAPPTGADSRGPRH